MKNKENEELYQKKLAEKEFVDYVKEVLNDDPRMLVDYIENERTKNQIKGFMVGVFVSAIVVVLITVL